MVVSKNISESTETNCQFGDFFLIYAEELGAKDWIGHEDEDWFDHQYSPLQSRRIFGQRWSNAHKPCVDASNIPLVSKHQ